MTLILPPDFGTTPKTKLVIPEGMTKLLVQVCCAPCCGAVLECFQVHGISPTLFFYNPNIHPRAEYEKRRDELIELADLLGFAYIVPEYDPKEWFAKVKEFALANGYAKNPKEYSKNPEAYKGSVSDVATVLRVLVTGRTNSPDLCSIMKILGKERVLKRLNIIN